MSVIVLLKNDKQLRIRTNVGENFFPSRGIPYFVSEIKVKNEDIDRVFQNGWEEIQEGIHRIGIHNVKISKGVDGYWFDWIDREELVFYPVGEKVFVLTQRKLFCPEYFTIRRSENKLDRGYMVFKEVEY